MNGHKHCRMVCKNEVDVIFYCFFDDIRSDVKRQHHLFDLMFHVSELQSDRIVRLGNKTRRKAVKAVDD